MYLPLLALAVVAYLAHSGKKSEPSSPVAPGPGGTPPPKAPDVTPPPTMPDYPNIPGDIVQPTQPTQPTQPAPNTQNLGTPMKPGSEVRSSLRDALRNASGIVMAGGIDAVLLQVVPENSSSGMIGFDKFLVAPILADAAGANNSLRKEGQVYPFPAEPGRVAEALVHESGQYLVSRQSPKPGQPANMHLPYPGTWWLVAQHPGFNVLAPDSIAESVSDWFEDNF